MASALRGVWQIVPIYSGFFRMLCFVLGSLELFASQLGLSWTGPANNGGGGEVLVDGSSWGGRREGGALGKPAGLGCGGSCISV